ncbi:MAG TPA: hypothetical protein VM238_07040, partial [Phycisphaerae bacterium]|nr:hypothetical protein [Phycisphaerae bacterium]
RWQVKDIKDDLDELREEPEKNLQRIIEVDRQRLVCKVESAEIYARKGELESAVREQTARFDHVDETVDNIHSRITRLAENLSHMQGQQEGKPRRTPS